MSAIITIFQSPWHGIIYSIQYRPVPDPSLFPHFVVVETLFCSFTLKWQKAGLEPNQTLSERNESTRAVLQWRQLEGGTAAETCICNCSHTTFKFRFRRYTIRISSSKIPPILTAREKDGGTSTPGKLATRRYLCRCHGSSCCACQGGISVNMSPQSSIAVGTHTRGGEPVVPDTGQRHKPNSWCWVWGMQRSNKPMGQLERDVQVPPWRQRVFLCGFLKVIRKMKCTQRNDGRNITWGHC